MVVASHLIMRRWPPTKAPSTEARTMDVAACACHSYGRPQLCQARRKTIQAQYHAVHPTVGAWICFTTTYQCGRYSRQKQVRQLPESLDMPANSLVPRSAHRSSGTASGNCIPRGVHSGSGLLHLLFVWRLVEEAPGCYHAL